MDKLPQAGDQAWELHRARGEAHHPSPGSSREQVNNTHTTKDTWFPYNYGEPNQCESAKTYGWNNYSWGNLLQMGSHNFLPSGEDGQWHQELLEHASEEETEEDAKLRRWYQQIWALQSPTHLQRPVGEEAANWHPHREASTSWSLVLWETKLPRWLEALRRLLLFHKCRSEGAICHIRIKHGEHISNAPGVDEELAQETNCPIKLGLVPTLDEPPGCDRVCDQRGVSRRCQQDTVTRGAQLVPQLRTFCIRGVRRQPLPGRE